MGKRLIIGLTGPMCAGKNLAAGMLERMGCAVIDADTCVHEAIERSKDVIAKTFGAAAREHGVRLVREDGTIDRRALGVVVFSDPALLAAQERIVHPAVNDMLNEFIDAHRDQSVVLNATVLYKAPVVSRCDFIIYVDSPAVTRFFRALRRDGLHPVQIIRRFFAQKGLFAQHREKTVDIYRVRNGGRADKLRKQLETVLYKKGY